MPNQRAIIKLKPTILMLFILVVSIVVSVMLYMQYNSNKTLSIDITKKTFNTLSEKIVKQLKSYESNSKSFIEILEKLENIEHVPKMNKKHKYLEIITSYLNSHTESYAIYIGGINGSFYEVINLNADKGLKEKFIAPNNARWLIVKIQNNHSDKSEEFLDDKLNILTSRKSKSSYDPSQRPWFITATTRKQFIKTAPYKYSNINKNGITFAKQIPKNSQYVIGLDITLDTIQTLLDNQKLIDDSELFLYNNKGKVISYRYAGENKTVKQKMSDYYPTLLTQSQEIDQIILNNTDYFHYKSKVLSQDDYEEYLQIVTPVSKIMEPFFNEIYKYILTTIIVFIVIAIPLILYASKLITHPIAQIGKENEKIKNGNFDDVKQVKSYIVEVEDLSSSLLEMAQAIKKFQNDQKHLMDSFIQLIATAIDDKSKYTGGHCSRVPELSLMLMEEASKTNEGIFKDFTIENEDQKRELSISAWLHDCGKVTTPEYVVDKATKLETIYNRIHEIRTRFEVIYRDLIIESYEKIAQGQDKEKTNIWLEKEFKKLQSDFEFLANANIGGEFMSDEDIKRVEGIGSKTWVRNFDNKLGLSNIELLRFSEDESTQLPVTEKLLDDKAWHIIKREDLEEKMQEYEKFSFNMEIPKNLYNLGEIYNLSIKKGTLTYEERHKIQEHVSTTIKMLEELPFPEKLKNVPKFAGGHHETLIGTGYPKKLTKEQMPLVTRIIALADVFEALTASDRPYKDKKTLSASIKILSFMVKDQHIDKDLFELFLRSGLHKVYAQKFLEKDQIDEVDIEKYLT